MADGRFAPSPTGRLHLGNLRTALVAWLFARSAGSSFLLRMEDLDAGAVRAEHYRSQPEDLAALGIDWDGEVVRQSERRSGYEDALERLVAAGLTYPCWCSRREIREAVSAPHGTFGGAYPGTCRDRDPASAPAGRTPALRLRASGERVRLVDRIAGPYERDLDDIVLRRNDGAPAYHLAVVVDDGAQGIGEVVRADDLLPSTPSQIHLARLLGIEPPTYAHVPLVLAPDGARLAKRHGAVTLADRAARGETAADVLSTLAVSLGLGERGEAATAADLLPRFDPARLPRTPWVLGPDVL